MVQLNISYNQFQTLPGWIFLCWPALEQLLACNNLLESMGIASDTSQTSVRCRDVLQGLDLSYNSLTNQVSVLGPVAFPFFSWISTDQSWNQSCPPEFWLLFPALKTVIIRGNHFDPLPTTLISNPNVWVNHVTPMPDKVSGIEPSKRMTV
jgi:hypothetical protein